MVAVIIAGGSGTRLWPLSTPKQPKQFLKLLTSQDTLIKQTYDNLSPVADDVFVVAPESFRSLAQEAIPELKPNRFISEPAPKGTANAIFLALAKIQSNYNQDEPLFFAWADHLIGDVSQYRQSLTVAQQAIKGGKGLIKFGIKPTRPATTFGYIELGKPLSKLPNIFELKSFKEKPDQRTANQFINSGHYLWNAGYFMTTANFLQSELETVNPQAARSLAELIGCPDSKLPKMYSDLTVATIEQELSERLRRAYVIACDFAWADLGSFRDLHDHSQSDKSGNYLEGEVIHGQLTNNYILNKTDIPLACTGLDNLVVIVTETGILVADKDQVAEIGELAKRIDSYTIL